MGNLVKEYFELSEKHKKLYDSYIEVKKENVYLKSKLEELENNYQEIERTCSCHNTECVEIIPDIVEPDVSNNTESIDNIKNVEEKQVEENEHVESNDIIETVIEESISNDIEGDDIVDYENTNKSKSRRKKNKQEE